MQDRHQAEGYWFAVIVLLDVLVAFVTFHQAFAQQVPSRTLDEILLRLDSNLQHYDTQVPSFFCDEHVISSLVYGKQHQVTTTDSVFRLKRVRNPDQTTTLVESRDVKTVNGSPAEGQRMSGPSILSGVFSGGLDTVSLSQKACMHYTLQPSSPEHPGEAYVVQFETVPGGQHASGCVLREDGAGRVFIDPATMQVTRMEITAPRHTIMPAVVGVWNISVSYSPVLLGGQTFWMPTAITSRASPNEADDPTVWWYGARYSNCHRLEVTSRIVPLP